MILPTMSYPEAAAAAEREIGTCRKKILDCVGRFGSLVKKSSYRTAFPMEKLYTVTSRDRTDIYVNCVARRRSDWDSPSFHVFVPFHMQRGLFSVALSQRRNILIFTDHFFTRYRERILRDDSLSALDVVTLFHRRNSDIVISRDTKAYSRSYAKYETGELPAIAARCPDGNCFGEFADRRTIVIRTIISDEMLRDGQDDAFSRLEDRRRLYNTLLDKEYRNAVKTIKDNDTP